MTKSKILLEILTECQHCRTITQVAQKLYVSQPYVSQILQNAEQQYQVTLVDRETLPIQVTLAGKRLLKYLIQLTDDENAQMKVTESEEFGAMVENLRTPDSGHEVFKFLIS